ncbi:MAG: flagellar hook-associated protein FlgL [Pyrinomonadaceae bacterium]
MTYRITDSFSSANTTARINSQRSLLGVLQERISSGKRINRPSDDPSGAEMVLKLRTSQAEIEQFKRSAGSVNQKLTAADDTLSSYENVLDRVKTLMAQGLSDTTTQAAKNALATEIQSLRERILSTANTKSGDEYLFGGTRQNAPPFDPANANPASTPTNPQYVQIEPGANAIASGVTAETIFADATSTIFADLDAAVSALRGTGNAATDHATLENTMSRLKIYSDAASLAHAKIGANMNITEIAQERLSGDFLSLDERANDIEGDDFAETALKLAEAQRSLDATLQVAANGRRSLFDFLG